LSRLFQAIRMMSDELTPSKIFQEVYISVDVETAGPNPGQYSLLSIGACTLDEPPDTFYVELKPVNLQALPQALEISQLSLEELGKHVGHTALDIKAFYMGLAGCTWSDTSLVENMLAQADQLIIAVIRALEGDREAEIVRLLLRLRDSLTEHEAGQELNARAEAARAEVINVVNNFFYERLTAMPTIKDYMEGMKG